MKLKRLSVLKKFSAILGVFALVGLFAIGLIFDYKQKVSETSADTRLVMVQRDFSDEFSYTNNNSDTCTLSLNGYYQFLQYYNGVSKKYQFMFVFNEIQFVNGSVGFDTTFQDYSNDLSTQFVLTSQYYDDLLDSFELTFDSLNTTGGRPQPDMSFVRLDFVLSYGTSNENLTRVMGIGNVAGSCYGTVNYQLLDDNIFDDLGQYEQGYNDGYGVGEVYGEQVGYTNGYTAGVEAGKEEQYQIDLSSFQEYYANGYTAGYQNGQSEDTVVSSIFSGILQVGMLPVSFFLSIFNFEILGINIASFVSALLTIAVTIVVIRMVVGSKGD